MDNQKYEGRPPVVGESSKFNINIPKSPYIEVGNKNYYSSQFARIYEDATNLLPSDSDTSIDSPPATPPVTPTEIDWQSETYQIISSASETSSTQPVTLTQSTPSNVQPVPQLISSQFHMSSEELTSTPPETDLLTSPETTPNASTMMPLEETNSNKQPIILAKLTSSDEPVIPSLPEVTSMVLLFIGLFACMLAAIWKWSCIDVYRLAFVGAVVNLVTLDL